MGLLERLTEDLARDALAQAKITGDDDVVKAVATALGDTSGTMEEAFNTAVRYLRAEARARDTLKEMAPKNLSLPAPGAD